MVALQLISSLLNCIKHNVSHEISPCCNELEDFYFTKNTSLFPPIYLSHFADEGKLFVEKTSPVLYNRNSHDYFHLSLESIMNYPEVEPLGHQIKFAMQTWLFSTLWVVELNRILIKKSKLYLSNKQKLIRLRNLFK